MCYTLPPCQHQNLEFPCTHTHSSIPWPHRWCLWNFVPSLIITHTLPLPLDNFLNETLVRIGRSCGSYAIWKYREVRIMWRYWKLMMRTSMYFPTVIADSWVVNTLKMVYTCLSNSSQSIKICIGSHGSFVDRWGDRFIILLMCDEKE